MISSTQKFNKELNALQTVKQFPNNLLHPLRQEQIKQKILGKITNTRQAISRVGFPLNKKKFILRYVLPAALGISLVGGSAFASASALPGDTLYPVKEIKEQTMEILAPSKLYYAQLHARYGKTLISELDQLKAKCEKQNQSASIQDRQNMASLQVQAKAHAESELKHV